MDLELLLKLRVVVARCGEMDRLRWWNTRGQLGPLGKAALRRGFPRTHWFAQARSVFAVADHRCREIFDAPDAVTLWRFTEDVEEQFEARWEHWLDDAEAWTPFFERVAESTESLNELLEESDLIDSTYLDAYVRLRRTADGRAVLVPGTFDDLNADARLLAMAFGRGEPGALAVPHMRIGR